MSSSNNDRGYSTRSIRNGLIAGYTAGITGTVMGHPLDSIKVLLQTNGGASGAQRSAASMVSAPASATIALTRASSSTAAIQSTSVKANVSTVSLASSAPSQPAMVAQGSIAGKRSLRALYAGVTGPLLMTGILQSLNFAIYDSVRRVLYQRQIQSEHPDETICCGKPGDYLHYDNLSNVAMASFVAGATTSVLTSPMVIVKTKQQIMVWGFRQAIRETFHCGMNGKPQFLNGMRNFYTGFGVHFVCDAVGRSMYMFSYELLKRKLAQAKCSEPSLYSNSVSTQDLSVPERMVCAASAGMACWALIFPADVIRSKLYAKSLTTQSSLTTLDGITMARQMVREQGIQSLYRGITITVARAGPVAAAVLPVYDSMLEWVSS